MSDLRTAAQQALEALELALSSYGVMLLSDPPQDAWKTRGVESKSRLAITALRAALEQPSREWRGLKEWEINDGLDQLPTEDVCSWSFRKGVYFAEAALKERNV